MDSFLAISDSSSSGKPAGIQNDHAEFEGFDFRSIRDLFIKKIFLTSLGIANTFAYHTIYTYKIGRGNFQLIIMKFLTED